MFTPHDKDTCRLGRFAVVKFFFPKSHFFYPQVFVCVCVCGGRKDLFGFGRTLIHLDDRRKAIPNDLRIAFASSIINARREEKTPNPIGKIPTMVVERKG